MLISQQDDFLEACREEDINKVSSILQQKPSVIDLNYFDSKFVLIDIKFVFAFSKLIFQCF